MNQNYKNNKMFQIEENEKLPTTIRSENDRVVNGPEQYRSLSAKLALPALETCSRSPEHRSD